MLEREGELFSTRNRSLTLLLLLLLFEIDLGRIWMRLLDCASSSRSDYRLLVLEKCRCGSKWFENVARFGYAHCVSSFILDWPSNVGEVLIVVPSLKEVMYGCLILIGGIGLLSSLFVNYYYV